MNRYVFREWEWVCFVFLFFVIIFEIYYITIKWVSKRIKFAYISEFRLKALQFCRTHFADGMNCARGIWVLGVCVHGWVGCVFMAVTVHCIATCQHIMKMKSKYSVCVCVPQQLILFHTLRLCMCGIKWKWGCLFCILLLYILYMYIASTYAYEYIYISLLMCIYASHYYYVFIRYTHSGAAAAAYMQYRARIPCCTLNFMGFKQLLCGDRIIYSRPMGISIYIHIFITYNSTLLYTAPYTYLYKQMHYINSLSRVILFGGGIVHAFT